MIKLDRFGLIVQKNGDGGDCAANTGTLFTALAFKNKRSMAVINNNLNSARTLILMMNQLEKTTGQFIRHREAPHNDPKTFSRDQTTPIVCAMGLFSPPLFHNKLKLMLKNQFGRFLKYQNADFPAPNHLGYFFRALDLWWMWPYHLFADLFFLPSVFESMGIIPRFKHETWKFYFPTPDDVDDRNLILGLILAHERQPTPISWLARKLYSKFRKKNYGNIWLGEKSKVMGSLSWYFRLQSGGNKEIAEELREIINRIFK